MTLALVLGGGGVAGIAWETGLLAGLREAGFDLSGADLFVGTSAGSVVGAQLATGCELAALYARQTRPFDPSVEQGPPKPLAALLVAMARTWRPYGTSEQRLARLGALAIKARTPSEASRLETIAARLPIHTWPERRLLITTVDAASGAFVVWDKGSGVPLPLAVASSCAVPILYPPTTINGRRYMDGGMRSPNNADLPKGYERVLVVAVTPSGSLQKELAALRASGSRVALVEPDRAAHGALFPNLMDPARRLPSARAGFAQAAAAAPLVRSLLG